MNELLLRVLRPVFPLLPRKFFKHYVKPLILKREQVPYEQGTVVESGPFSDGKGGLYILSVRDKSEARAFVSADPYSAAGMKLIVREWQSSRDPQ